MSNFKVRQSQMNATDEVDWWRKKESPWVSGQRLDYAGSVI